MKEKQRSESERRQQEDAAGPALKTKDGAPIQGQGAASGARSSKSSAKASSTLTVVRSMHDDYCI